MAAKPPDAFLSYTRFDDRHGGGAISEFCRRLASAVQAVTGVPFDIFQDVEGIGVGEHWRGKLNQMLNEARFFIPIVTPSYFTSKPCRDELEKFLRAEAERERNDLVLPIYYIESEVLEDAGLRAADPLARTLHERQREDWRELRFEPFPAGNVRRALERLAREIVKARRRPMLPPSTRQRDAPTTTGTEVASLSPGTAFRDKDAPWCPELVVIPPGEFMMGSTEAEREWVIGQGTPREWVEWEQPQHLVRIAYPLAVGRYPVTFDEYGHFARTTGRAQPNDQGWGRGRRPVINVDWQDAKAFADWLSVQTGEHYRLLSEAEWEYACRGGTSTRYWWGDEITPENANYGATTGKTSEVGSYTANAFGLYDTHGNVWEWVEDCWNDSYQRAGRPDDGSAWTTGDCGWRVLRGGSWDDDSDDLRSAFRVRKGTDFRVGLFGFRVARQLKTQRTARPLKDTDRRERTYHNPELAGQVIGRYEFFFETKWSKANDRSIHLYNDPASIVGVAEAPDLQSYNDILDLASYDMSSRARTIQEGEHAILKNHHNKYAVLKILDIKDRTRSDAVDELTFEFWIITDTP